MHDWERIRKQNGGIVFSSAYRILRDYDLAIECLQDVFFEAFRDFQRTEVASWPALLRWLAIRRALDRFRATRQDREMRATSVDSSRVASREEGPGDRSEFDELVSRLRSEITHLPTKQGEAFWLHCVEQASTTEVSEMMGIDEGEVRVLIHRARTKLRTWLVDLAPQTTTDKENGDNE